MQAREIMTADPIVAQADATVGEVLRMLHDLDVRHLPIVDDGGLVGMVSDRDLRGITASLDASDTHSLGEVLASPVAARMSSDVLTVDDTTEVSELIDLMLEQKVGAVPVVDLHSGELVGIVSYVDILRELRDQLG